MSLTPENFRDKAPRILVDGLSTNNNVLIDAPPGLGKTKSGAKAAIELVQEKNRRVLLLEPTKTLRQQMVRYLREEDVQVNPHESKAYQDYHCPINNTWADPSLCTTRKELCRKEGRGCGVLADIDRVVESNMTVATFAKFLLSKSSFSGYDTLIVDESHGFENAETTYLQTYILISKLEAVADQMRADYPEASSKLESLASGLTRYREMIGDSTPLAVDEINTIREAIGDEQLKAIHLECSRKVIHPEYRNLYSSISGLHYRAQNINDSVFFFYEGALYARPKNMSSEVSNFFKDKNVALLSATVGKAIPHAKACGIDLRRFPESRSQIMEEYPKVRRDNRLLLALTDGPNLSKNEETYESARNESNRIIGSIIESFQLRTLVLFRSYSDHKSASAFLEDSGLSNRLISIEQSEDPDKIEEKIHHFKQGSSVVMTTASSRLWEGVDIPGLRLVVIDALPFPGRDPLYKDYNFVAGHVQMIKKLKQGLGRIVRADDDWGAAVVIDNRFEQRFRTLGPQLPWHMREDFRHVANESALAQLNDFVSHRS